MVGVGRGMDDSGTTARTKRNIRKRAKLSHNARDNLNLWMNLQSLTLTLTLTRSSMQKRNQKKACRATHLRICTLMHVEGRTYYLISHLFFFLFIRILYVFVFRLFYLFFFFCSSRHSTFFIIVSLTLCLPFFHVD